ncbi:hypothetical protein B0H12DRAFT_1228040 [Mycena haematopus]|nr:hypothetical protein B0H12DRAFT_1237541 [Mycena haematopus]KAJ7275582.1 hypothetical protein B0H12DRAFT_1228040 [Mycena haematopus]
MAPDFFPQFFDEHLALTIISNMGRRALYLTQDQKTSADRKDHLKYSRSPRGKAAKARLRQPAHRRKQAKYVPESTPECPTSIPGLPALNTEIEKWYNTPLPENEPLFKEALRSADALDESDLMRWKTEPPFVEDDDTTDPYSAGYLKYTHSLTHVLHGVRLREQNAEDLRWRAKFAEDGWVAALHDLKEEVQLLLERWERMEDLSTRRPYHPFHASREHAMFQVYVQWLARTIFHQYYLKFLL